MKWFFARLLAGLVVSAAAGILFAFGFTILSVASEHGLSGDSIGSFAKGLAGLTLLGGVYGAILGIVPATLVICLTNARFQPWKAAPFLIAGALIGTIAGVALAQFQPFVRLDGYYVWALFATLGGVVAAMFVKKPAAATQA